MCLLVLAVPSWLYTDHSAGESAGALPAQAEASGFYYHHLGQSIQEEIENQAAVFTHDTGYCGQNISYCSPTSAVIQKGLHLVRKRSHQGMQVLTSHGIECIIESVKAAVLLGPAIAGADRDDPTCACDGI